MNTIPSIFNVRQINHTVLGGGNLKTSSAVPITCLLINRSGSLYRTFVLDNLLSKGFDQIISVELNNRSFNADALSRQYPSVRFIVALEDVSVGDMINMGMAEAACPYVFIIHDDLAMNGISFTMTLLRRFAELNAFCVCPRLCSSDQKNLPVQFEPVVVKSVFDVEPTPSFSDGKATMYSFDWAGLYNREAFIQLGGVDYTIGSPYWQKMDLFFRSWLWGETTLVSAQMHLSYSSEVVNEDKTADQSYLRFYLKNLLPVYRNDHAMVPASSFLAFFLRSSCGLGEAIVQFKEAKRWTEENKYRFKMDAAILFENWGSL